MIVENVPDDAARRYLVLYSLEIHAVGQELSRNIDFYQFLVIFSTLCNAETARKAKGANIMLRNVLHDAARRYWAFCSEQIGSVGQQWSRNIDFSAILSHFYQKTLWYQGEGRQTKVIVQKNWCERSKSYNLHT